MKTISAQLNTHMSGEVTSIATLWTLTRNDGTVFRFTDHDSDIEFPVSSGDIYDSSVGYNRTAMESQVGLSVDNLEVRGFLDSTALTEAELRAGLFDFAEVRISVVNWKDLTQGELKMRRGRIGEVTYSEKSGTFKAELRGLTQLYSQEVLELYQAECRADLGDARCKIDILPPILTVSTAAVVGQAFRFANGEPPNPITEDFHDRVFRATVAGTTSGAAPTFNLTIGGTTVWGTATFTAEQSFRRAATVTTIVSDRVFTVTFPNGVDPREVDDWFKYGGATWDTGANVGLTMEVKSFVASTDQVELFLEMPFSLVVGDKLGVYTGCDRRLGTCTVKFNNTVNFRGEPYVPGQDELFNYPDA